MSASREKKIRQASGAADTKKQREAEALKKQKRTNALYGSIALAFVVIAAAVLVWSSNIIQKNAAAVTVDGVTYNADEVSYYYHYTLNQFNEQYGNYLSYLGLDTSKPLDQQESIYGGTWDEYFKTEAINNLKFTALMCKAAEEAGYELTEDDEIAINNEISYTKFYAETNNVDYKTYVRALFGKLVTPELFEKCLRECTLADSYANSIFQSYSFSDAEVAAHLKDNLRDFQFVDYSYFTAVAKTEEGADAPTEEAIAEAKAVTEEILARVEAGEDLETVSKDYEDKGTFTHDDGAMYFDDELTNWLFDANRTAGDATITESGNNSVIAVFNKIYLEEYNTVDANIIRMAPATADLDSESETYEADLAAKMDEAIAKAEEVFNTWKSGDATLDSFKELANKHSNEGIPDGTYTQIYKGMLDSLVEEWLFDASREVGDVELIEGEDSVYIVYFTGVNDRYVDIQVDNALRTAEYNKYYEEAMNAVESSELSGMKYVG